MGATYRSTGDKQTPGGTRCQAGDSGSMTTESCLSLELDFSPFPAITLDFHAPGSEHTVGRDGDEQCRSCKDSIVCRDPLDQVNQLNNQPPAQQMKIDTTYPREGGSRILVVDTQTLVCKAILDCKECMRYIESELLSCRRFGIA